MKKTFKSNVYLSIGALWFGLALPLSAAIPTTIFDNSAHDLGKQFNPGTFQVGDEIILAGTARTMTFFSFQYWGIGGGPGGTFAGPIQAEVRFYQNTGAPFNTYPTPAASPFWDSGLFSVLNPTTGSTFVFLPGSDNIPIGGLILPASDMTWSVTFSGMGGGDSVGVELYSPPVVGADYPDYWQNTGSGWTLETNSLAANMDFGAVMQATPEPSSMTLSLVGGLGILMAMRRLRRKE
jgi:hypothetical protein